MPNQSLCVCVCVFRINEWMRCSNWVLTSFSTFVMGIVIYGKWNFINKEFCNIFKFFLEKKNYTWKMFNQNYNIKNGRITNFNDE
jgi:hypothetical protein